MSVINVGDRGVCLSILRPAGYCGFLLCKFCILPTYIFHLPGSMYQYCKERGREGARLVPLLYRLTHFCRKTQKQLGLTKCSSS